MVDTPDEDPLQLDESDQYDFEHAARGYGVEIYGGTPERRQKAVQYHYDTPVTIIDCSDVTEPDEIVEKALRELGAEEEINKMLLTMSDVAEQLVENDGNLVLAEFDSMEQDLQRVTAQKMKNLAERLPSRSDTMLGFTCEEGGAIVRAESDLSIRVRSIEIEPTD